MFAPYVRGEASLTGEARDRKLIGLPSDRCAHGSRPAHLLEEERAGLQQPLYLHGLVLESQRGPGGTLQALQSFQLGRRDRRGQTWPSK